MKKCILKGIDLTDTVDSEAHVIPSALGGRLKPMGILSRLANEELNHKFDNPLIQAYNPFMVQVDGSRDKSGELPPIDVQDSDGKHYKMGVDYLRPTRPEFIQRTLPDGQKLYTFKVATRKELRTNLGRLKKEYPDIDIDGLVKGAITREEPAGAINFSLRIGPITTFPAIFVMAATFASHCGVPHHQDFVSYVDGFDKTVPTLPPDTFFFLPKTQWFTQCARVGHYLVLYCDTSKQQAIFFAQMFNQPGIAVSFPYLGQEDQVFSYGVDVESGATLQVGVDTKKLAEITWRATHVLGDQELFGAFRSGAESLVKISQLRQRSSETDKILNRFFSGNPGQVITEEHVRRTSRELAELAMRGWRSSQGS